MGLRVVSLGMVLDLVLGLVLDSRLDLRLNWSCARLAFEVSMELG